MSAAREAILARVRQALAPLETRAPLPDWDPALVAPAPQNDLWASFATRFAENHGRAITDPSVLAAQLRAGGWTKGYCDPELWPLFRTALGEGFEVTTEYRRDHALSYTFGITRATAAIAETGTLILGDLESTSRLAALAPWVHVAVLPRTRIVASLGEALATQPKDPNLVWVGGPSKTGDIEGVLIEGIHGPGVQYAFGV